MRILQASEFTLQREVDYGTEEQNLAVQRIIREVRNHGDEALRKFALEFDKVEVHDLRVSPEEIEAAYKQVDESFLSAIRQAAANIRTFHEKQKRSTWMDLQPSGSIMGQVIRPLRRVGLYVPGGTAAYPSSVLMNAIPAQVAGVPEVAMVTPMGTAGSGTINPHILVAAAEAGVREVYRTGGAQAVAALAYGTETIRAVDKIVGPGDIDMLAGPTDVVVLADETADPVYCSADLLAQAEHDALSPAILITPSRALAEAVREEVQRQLERLPRKAIAQASTSAKGAVLLVGDLEEGIRVLNEIAPEHAELLVEDPFACLPRIENAGAIFSEPTVPNRWAITSPGLIMCFPRTEPPGFPRR